SEARFREIFRAAPDMMTLVRRRDGTYLDVNPAFEEFTGYRRDEALGRTSRDLGIWAEPARREEMFRELARTGQLRDFEYAMRRRDGTIRHHLLSASALEIAGEPCYLFVIRDVTDRRRAEEALRESEERFRALVELSSDWYWQTDEQHRFVFREGEILYRMGIPPADDYGKTRWELDFVNMTEADWAAHRALLERREEFRDLLLARRSPDGRIHWATISGRPLYDRSGRFLGYHGTGRDITAQMRAEQALRASEAELRLLADNLPAMIFHVAPDLRLRYANRSFVEFYLGEGVSPEGKRMDELLGPSAFAAIMPALTRARRGESVHYRARRRRRSDGSMRDLDVALIPLRDADGTVRGVVGLILDVTERVGMEESLRIRNRALEASINAVIIAQPTARGQSIVYVNPAFERITGYSAAEVIGRDPNFLHGEDREQPGVAALRAALAEEREATVLVRNYRKDGTPYWSELRVAPVRDENGRVTHFVGISADVTERVEAEQRLQALAADLERRVAERTRELQAAVRELESFSYTVSHDLRAPLRAIAGFAHLLREEAGGALGDEARRLLGRIEANAMHMGALIDGLLALSRYSRQPLHRTAVDVAAIVREALETLESEVRARNAEVLIGELPPCRADPLLLRQVYANLLSNALKYSAGRGRPRIEVGARREDDETVYFVRDNGVGFDMRYAGRLFGVFERLHSASEFPGIGIGLSTVRRIVERHGGRVWAEAAPDAGATFFFTLGRGEDEGR
ncbi:MAG: PAS domain S-box protein, partial [Burkholderiales bacterium]|nr:PAS domain S-box protein [Burkholderiales bacterium]